MMKINTDMVMTPALMRALTAIVGKKKPVHEMTIHMDVGRKAWVD
jgi:hypothetical protein